MKESALAYFFYILRCRDNSLYCGVALDVAKRVEEHNFSKSYGAKYTKSRRPVGLVYAEKCIDKSTALRREAEVKKWNKQTKEKLIAENNSTV